MQVTSKEEIFKPYLCLFSGSKVVCLDNRFCVVSCESSLLEPGECVLKSVRETVPEPLGVVMDTTLYKNEHFYCLRLHPIKNGIGETIAYIGEILDSGSVRGMMERTEGPSDILPLYNAVEMNSAAIWKHAANLRYGMVKAKDYTRLTEVLGIETAMSNLSSVCENAFNYAEMLYRTQRETVVDAGELCENLAKRCNAALAKCGRRIEALIDPGSLYIYADSRRAVVALVNAVQNALLYSPKETEPILTVCYRESRGRKFVEIRVVNESSMFSSKDFSGSVDVNFSYQRLGLRNSDNQAVCAGQRRVVRHDGGKRQGDGDDIASGGALRLRRGASAEETVRCSVRYWYPGFHRDNDARGRAVLRRERRKRGGNSQLIFSVFSQRCHIFCV